MRELFLSSCEKTFVQKIISEGFRLDGRHFNEVRKLDLTFGSEWGSCIVSLGETRVLAQVSCEVAQPKLIRPNEGILHINVEIGPMAAPQFELNRQTDLSVYLNRLLEKCLKDSKCVDLESLCIVVEEKVWSLRVDIRVLNHAGNLIECASIAALTSLAHFKRPDVTRSGDNVIIHTITERDPIPTVLYHYPVCVTYAIFGNDLLIADPSLLEESVCTSNTEAGVNAGGLFVVGMNQYREICLMDLTGAALSNANLVYKATVGAAARCKDVVDVIKQAIIKDDNLRLKRTKVNLGDIITTDHLLSLSKKDISICLKNCRVDDLRDVVMSGDDDMDASDVEESKYDVVSKKPHTVEIVPKKNKSDWVEISSESEDDCVIVSK